MDNSLKPAIEKIKLKEHDNEMRLKEKRELNSAILALNRAIRDAASNIENLTKEHQSLIIATEKLENQVLVEKIRHSALGSQVDDCRSELEKLQKTSIEDLSSVWEKRTQLFQTVHQVSDKCDIWALLLKPTCEIKPSIAHIPKKEQNIQDDTKLKGAIERKNKAIAMRNILLSEPEVGEEFVRTRNAIQYSLEIMATDQDHKNESTPENINRIFRSRRSFSSLEANENDPIKFSTSGASRKTVKPVMRKVNIDMPWYQPYSVVGSIAVFLIYFCILREESDIDREFDKTLYDRIKGLEKEQLLQTYRFNKEHGKSVLEIELRLKELEEQEKTT